MLHLFILLPYIAPSAAKKSSTASNVSNGISVSPIKGSNKKMDPQSGAPRNKKAIEMAVKRNEKRESAKEAYRKQMTKESAKDVINAKDTVAIKSFPGDVDVVKVTDTTMEKTSDDTTTTIIATTTTISISAAPPYSIEKAIENVAPPQKVVSENKMQNNKQTKQTTREETTPAPKPATNTKTSSSSNNSINSSNTNSGSSNSSNNSAAVKEKDKSNNKDKEKLRKDSEVNRSNIS